MSRRKMRNSYLLFAVAAVTLFLAPVSEARVDRQLVRAVQQRDLLTLKKLLAEGVDPNATDQFGRTILYFAVWIDDSETLRTLIAGGARVNVADRIGMAPLHCAARAANPGAIRALLEAGADVNARDREGFTPIHSVAGRIVTDRKEPSWQALADTIQALVDAGVDLKGQDRRGRTAVILAQQTGNGTAAAILKSYGQGARTPNQRRGHTRVPMEYYRALATKAINVFGLGLYARLVRTDKNLVFSPLGVFSPLSIGAEGAEGLTRDEMLQVLGITRVGVPFTTTLGSLLRELPHTVRQDGGQLEVANGIWVRKSSQYRIRRQFEKTLRSHYDASISAVDAEKPAHDIAAEINVWVKKQTHNRITNLVSPGDLAKQSWVLSVVNAIYFKSDWAIPFESNKTKDDSFTRLDGSQIKVPMMNISCRNFRYMEETGFQALEMPYRGWGLSMVVFLPRDTDGLSNLEKNLTPENLTRWVDQLSKWPAGANVCFPRFVTRSHLRLKAPLQSMGMRKAFERQADFSGMIEDRTPPGRYNGLFVSSVLHEATIEVNEKGTQATAASGALWAPSTNTPAPKDFRADHPFIFIIYDKVSGCILFMGRVTDPSKMN